MSFDPSPWADDGVSPWAADHDDDNYATGFGSNPYGEASELAARATTSASDSDHRSDREGSEPGSPQSEPPFTSPDRIAGTHALSMTSSSRVTPAELLGTSSIANTLSSAFVAPSSSPQTTTSSAARRPRTRRVTRAPRVSTDVDPLATSQDGLKDVALDGPSPRKACQGTAGQGGIVSASLNSSSMDWAHASVHEALGQSLSHSACSDEQQTLLGSQSEQQKAGVDDDDDDFEEETLEGTLKTEIGDPSTVGELAGAHTIYTVITTADGVEGYPSNSVVTRRYRDFRWLYKELVHSHPGVIVPYPPDKKAMYRFAAQFIETRRAALASMIAKIVKLGELRQDRDLVAFLTHDDFAEYQRTRVVSAPGSTSHHGSQSQLQSLSGTTIPESPSSSSSIGGGGGLLGSLGSVFSSRTEDADPWVVERRSELDALEQVLRELFRSLEELHDQRSELANSLAEFGAVTTALADIGPTPRSGKILRAFARVHDSLAEQLRRQREQDSLFFSSTVEEQLRMVQSVRDALSSRQEAVAAASSARAEADKRAAALEKAQRSSARSAPERLAMLSRDRQLAAARADAAEAHAEQIARRFDSEYARAEREKISEFRSAVEVFLENAVEAQKQAIELWETFYARFCSEPAAA